MDFLPWWLNEVYWQDQLSGTRSVDVFDIHAYPDGPDTSGYTQAQKQALSLRIYRDYWDPTYTSESGSNQSTVGHLYPAEEADSIPHPAHAGDRQYDLPGYSFEFHRVERGVRG